MTTSVSESTASMLFAAEVRAVLARRGISVRAFATQLGVSHDWTNRRLAASRSVDVTLDDARRIALALEVPLADLLATS